MHSFAGLFLILALSAVPMASFATEYKCAEHKHFLVREDGGFEHINHRLSLNGNVLIEELENDLWFIERVKCTAQGFEITASHIQYGDPSKTLFLLKVIDTTTYQIQ